jgi:hypothetical protein
MTDPRLVFRSGLFIAGAQLVPIPELIVERTCDLEEVAPGIGKESKPEIARCIVDWITDDVDAAPFEFFNRIVYILHAKGKVMETQQGLAVG